MRALTIGDVHVHTNNIRQTAEFIVKIDEFVRAHTDRVDVVILMGDVLHTHERVHTVALNHAKKLFDTLCALKPTYVLVGNHDYINNSQFLSRNHWMNCVREKTNLTVVDRPVWVGNSVLCPYVPDGRFVEALETLAPPTKSGRQEEKDTGQARGWREADCIFAHQLFDGARMGAIVAQNVEAWRAEYPHVVSGHVHDKQRVAPNLYYTGSSMQHAFGESDDKVVQIVDTSSVGIEEFSLGLPRKRIVYATPETVFDVAARLIAAEKGGRVAHKLTLKCRLDEFKAIKKSARFRRVAEKINVVFKSNEVGGAGDALPAEENGGDEQGDDGRRSAAGFMDILAEVVRKAGDERLDDLFAQLAREF